MGVRYEDFYVEQQRPLLRLCDLSTLDVEAAADAEVRAPSRRRWTGE